MKRHIALSALLSALAVMTASAQERPDTIAEITDASRLVITESPSGISVKVSRESESDTLTEIIDRSFGDAPVTVNLRRGSFPLGKSSGSRSEWDLCLGGPGIGWTNAVGQPDGLGIEMGKSLEISWLNMISVKYSPRVLRHTTFSIGFGFDWRNYRISTGQHRFISTEAGGVTTAPFPEGAAPHGSRLKVFGMGIPVLITQEIPVKWLDGSRGSISVGAVFNYNSHGSLKAEWTDSNGHEATYKTNHIGHRSFTLDLIGMVKVGWGLSLYARYSPQTVLRGSGQPKFRPFSTGLIFMY